MGQACSCLSKDNEYSTHYLSVHNNINNETGNIRSGNLSSIFDQLEIEEKYNNEHIQKVKNLDDYPDEVLKLVNRIKLVKLQSIVRGYIFRKKFKKNIREELVVKSFLENVFIQFNTEELEKKESRFPKFYPSGWTKFYEEDNPLFKVNYGRVFPDRIRKTFNNYYIGEMNLHDEKHGLGRLINKAGVIYDGHWLNDVFQGWGRMVYPNEILYEGYFKQGVLNGKGIYILPNNSKYEGNFVNGVKEGTGKEETDEFIYTGSFVAGNKHQNGKFFFKKTNDIYEGEVSENLISGYGFYKWDNQHTFTGTFKNGLMHGFGTYRWTDGGEYTGEYIDNIKEGMGTFKWANGRTYQGPFVGGVPHGKGKLIVNNKSSDAEFFEGKVVTSKSKKSK